tara:strand:+ start:33 stop:449 length:417 start_codon:yes stop_codon:yes gene_type:complete
MPSNIEKNMAPKEHKYTKLPYKTNKINRDDSIPEPKSPFTLGSNRESSPYTALQAKGLISAMHEKGEKEMKQGYRGKSDSQKAKDLKKQKQQTKKAAELTFATRFKESGLSLDEYKKTKEGRKLAADVQQREAEIQGY